MPEPFKNFFNEARVKGLATQIVSYCPQFDGQGFVDFVMSGLEDLELKERSARIAEGLGHFLPANFAQSAIILQRCLHPDEDTAFQSGADFGAEGVRGWMIAPMSHYVAEQGMGHFDLAMATLKEMTKRFTAEFAVRFFLLEDKDRALAIMEDWICDPNRHVRRLVSEGTRPRLPWAMRLPMFQEDPAPVLALLEKLKDDGEEYVRRSVANNLNDIAKDHPDLVAEVAARWMKDATKERQWLVRHALRTLVKQGHPKALAALGFDEAEVDLARLAIKTPVVTFGDALEFEVELQSKAANDQKLVIDYVVHHMKANGSLTPKVFKWTTITLPAGGAHKAQRKHAIRPITTRRYYPGLHKLEIVANGKSLGVIDFELAMDAVYE